MDTDIKSDFLFAVSNRSLVTNFSRCWPQGPFCLCGASLQRPKSGEFVRCRKTPSQSHAGSPVFRGKGKRVPFSETRPAEIAPATSPNSALRTFRLVFCVLSESCDFGMKLRTDKTNPNTKQPENILSNLSTLGWWGPLVSGIYWF